MAVILFGILYFGDQTRVSWTVLVVLNPSERSFFSLTNSVVDQELSAKIAQEHSLELESHDDSKDESVNEYLKSSPFTVTEKPGSHEIVLTREFGNEQ